MPPHINQSGSPASEVTASDEKTLHDLAAFVRDNCPLFVLTGAGCSTASGLADYRDGAGNWKRRQPISGSTFIHDESARKRYWARSSAGWPLFSAALPNAAHITLNTLNSLGYLARLVTQNVDSLHQSAGHPDVLDLHGRLGTVTCIDCCQQLHRDDFQQQLYQHNPTLMTAAASIAPDGDADLLTSNFDWVQVPKCSNCGGIVKPDVVFFGENVAQPIVEDAMQSLETASGMLVVGSSLMVYSGYRFCRRAQELSLPIAVINRGRTRADNFLTLKIDDDCGGILSRLVATLPSTASGCTH